MATADENLTSTLTLDLPALLETVQPRPAADRKFSLLGVGITDVTRQRRWPC